LDEPVGNDYVERLIHALDHPEPNTRALAALLLGKLGDERGLKALCEKARTSRDMALLEAVAEALSVGAWRFTFLQQSLQDRSPFGFAPKVKVYQDEVTPFSGVAGGAEDLLQSVF
jgi:HEAT repeat protein